MSDNAKSARPAVGFIITGRHVLFAMLAFFGIIFAVNAYLMNMALSTHSGVVANEPYRKGLKYNERISASERQADLGWRDEITLAAGGDRISIGITDKDGKAVSGLIINATIGRPASGSEDVSVTLAEGSAGRYDATIPRRTAGSYIASIEATDPAQSTGDIVFRAKERLWLKP
ncbi:MAG: FixH family protein [Hyphomicrobium sp.]